MQSLVYQDETFNKQTTRFWRSYLIYLQENPLKFPEAIWKNIKMECLIYFL